MGRPATAHQSPATRWVHTSPRPRKLLVLTLGWSTKRYCKPVGVGRSHRNSQLKYGRGFRSRGRGQTLGLSLGSLFLFSLIACIIPAVSMPPRATVRPRAARKIPGGFQCAEVKSAWVLSRQKGQRLGTSPPPQKGSYCGPSKRDECIPERNDAWRS